MLRALRLDLGSKHFIFSLSPYRGAGSHFLNGSGIGFTLGRKRDNDEGRAMGNMQRTAGATRSMKPRRLVPQKTLRSSVQCTGIGLHSGAKVTMTLRPAEPNAGISFVRTDLGVTIPARWDHVVDTRMCTVVGNSDGVSVGTVEHLMAALSGLNVDNVVVEVDGPELPVMDGSLSLIHI